MVNAYIVTITSIVPLIITPWSLDYYYHPKITVIYILSLFIALLYLFKLKRIEVEKQLEDYLLAGYILMIVLSTFFAVDMLQALKGRQFREEGLAAMFCYALIYFVASKYYKFKKEHLFLIIASACIIALYGIMQYFGYNIIHPDIFRVNLANQSYSTLGNRNFVGSYLVLILPLTLIGYLYKSKLIYLIASSVLYACLLCTLTRGAWLGFASSFIFMSFYILKNKEVRKRYLVSILLIFTITFGFNIISKGAVFGRLNSLGRDIASAVKSSSDSAGAHRMFIWKRAVKLIPERPLLGCGPDNFGIVFMNRYQTEVYTEWMPIYVDKAHNELLQIAVTTGIPSLLFYIAFIGCILWKGIRCSKENLYILSLTGSTLGYLIQGNFNISVVSVAPLFWVMLGLISNFYGRYRHEFKKLDEGLI